MADLLNRSVVDHKCDRRTDGQTERRRDGERENGL